MRKAVKSALMLMSCLVSILVVPGQSRAEPESLQPLRVYRLGGQVPVRANDARPRWSRDGSMLSFERSAAERQELIIVTVDGKLVKKISHRARDAGGDGYGLEALLPGIASRSDSYNAGLAWSPEGRRMVFMSNGGEGNYDLYLGRIGRDDVLRLTFDIQKDGQPDWNPLRDELVFVSGRKGSAQLYSMDVASRRAKALTRGSDIWLYPRWSPNGNSIAAMRGDSGDHNIYVIQNPGSARRVIRPLSTWTYDDISPSWSPDGEWVAFYSNYNEENDPHKWSIIVVRADGSDGLGADTLRQHVVAVDVQPNLEAGPAWSPDGAYLAYVRRDRQDYDPIYIVDRSGNHERRLLTGTRINRDISFSPSGKLAFRAQQEQWDRIFIAEPGRLDQ